MSPLQSLLDKNRAWAESQVAQDPQFFERLAFRQQPDYLWIGCADSRVPANELIDLPPGEVFVHRNIANVVVHTDFNCMSVMQFAVDVLKIQHIMVVGHYGCSGVRAAIRGERYGLVDNWLRNVRDVAERHSARLAAITDESARADRLCELNVMEQVTNVCQTTVIEDAWHRGQTVSVHGWVYSVRDGLLRDLGITASSREDLAKVQETALAGLFPD